MEQIEILEAEQRLDELLDVLAADPNRSFALIRNGVSVALLLAPKDSDLGSKLELPL
jgi:hypothetical protein